MADPQRKHQMTSKTMLLAAIAAVAIGGPLLAMMALTLFATTVLFLVSAPLFILFSPLLVGASFVFMAALVGFGLAAVTAIAGFAAFGWAIRSLQGSAGRYDWADHLKQKVQTSPENMAAIGGY